MIYLYVGQESCGRDKMLPDTRQNRWKLANEAMGAIREGLQVRWSRSHAPPGVCIHDIVIDGR